MTDESKIDPAQLFHALGDGTRRKMLDLLVERPRSVSELAGVLGVTLTAVGQHLQILEACRLVQTEKVGRVRSCRLEPAGFDTLEHWVQAHRTAWERRMDGLGELLGECPGPRG